MNLTTKQIVSVADGKRVMMGKLCEIFHCGAFCTKSNIK